MQRSTNAKTVAKDTTGRKRAAGRGTGVTTRRTATAVRAGATRVRKGRNAAARVRRQPGDNTQRVSSRAKSASKTAVQEPWRKVTDTYHGAVFDLDGEDKDMKFKKIRPWTPEETFTAKVIAGGAFVIGLLVGFIFGRWL